jgi:hypothetical protein
MINSYTVQWTEKPSNWPKDKEFELWPQDFDWEMKISRQEFSLSEEAVKFALNIIDTADVITIQVFDNNGKIIFENID